jgi:hypothetical protein
VFEPFSFAESTVTGIAYLDTSVQYLMPILQEEDLNDTPLQQDGPPLHFHHLVWGSLGNEFEGKLTGTGLSPGRLVHPTSLQLNFFFPWGYIKDGM